MCFVAQDNLMSPWGKETPTLSLSLSLTLLILECWSFDVYPSLTLLHLSIKHQKNQAFHNSVHHSGRGPDHNYLSPVLVQCSSGRASSTHRQNLADGPECSSHQTYLTQHLTETQSLSLIVFIGNFVVCQHLLSLRQSQSSLLWFVALWRCSKVSKSIRAGWPSRLSRICEDSFLQPPHPSSPYTSQHQLLYALSVNFVFSDLLHLRSILSELVCTISAFNSLSG